MKSRSSDGKHPAAEPAKNDKTAGSSDKAKIGSTSADPLADLLKAGRRGNRVRRIFMVIAALAIAAGIAVGVLQWQKGSADASVPRYVSEPVTKGDIVASISATGTVEALNTVEVGAEISGRILSLNADFNDAVTEGQVLAVIDAEQQKATVAQAKAQTLAAQAQVAEAEATLLETKQDAARAKDLAGKGLYSPKELESAQAKAVRAEASLKSAQASAALAKATFSAAKSKLSKTEIICPINGTVLSRDVEVGQTLNAGMQTPVLYIIAEDLRRMRLSSRVDEADIGSVRNGQSASFTVDAYPGRKFDSAVTSVRNVPQTDQNVVSYEVLLSVDNRDMLLKPGMTASVEIITEKHEGMMLVPNKALRFSPPKEDAGFRRPPGGGVPILSKATGDRGKQGKKPDPMRDLGKIQGNEGILWIVDEQGGPGALKPVKVEKIATDSIRTAIQSDKIQVGDPVVVEQADSGRTAP